MSDDWNQPAPPPPLASVGVPPSVAPALPPTPAPGRRSKSGIVLGLILLVIGLIGAAVVYLAQQSAYETSVKNLQRAATGLGTDFVFEKEGVFTLYYEYEGTFEAEVDGDVEEFNLDAPERPRRVELRLLDRVGDEVRLRREAPSVEYSVGGFRGIAYRQVSIRDTGTYTLEVDGRTGDDFAIAVGFGTIESPSVLFPALIAAGGVALGLLTMLILGRRRVPPAPPVGAPAGPAWSSPAPSGPPAAGFGGPAAGFGGPAPPVATPPGAWSPTPPAPPPPPAPPSAPSPGTSASAPGEWPAPD